MYIFQYIWHLDYKAKQALFFLPVTCSFYIMHVDLLIPGDTILLETSQSMVMNDMCDLIQFVVSIKLAEQSASYLAIF